jgi:hypothetical protein
MFWHMAFILRRPHVSGLSLSLPFVFTAVTRLYSVPLDGQLAQFDCRTYSFA